MTIFVAPSFDWDENAIIFGVDNSSSTHTDNRKNYNSVFAEGPRQRLYDTTVISEAKYYINITKKTF